MTAIRRKTDTGALIESFLDEHEDDISPNLWNLLEGLAEQIDDNTKELEDRLEELESEVEGLEEKINELEG